MKQSLALLFIVVTCLQCKSQAEETIAAGTASFSLTKLKHIDGLIQQAIDSGWAYGAVAFIAKDNRTVYNKAFGYADAATKKTMRTNAIFRIASQTKAVTSVALMMLYDEGKFALDDPVSKYIPAFAKPRVLDSFNEEDSSYTTVPANREITIKDLLTHTSGIDYALIGSPQLKAIYAKARFAPAFGNDTMQLVNMVNKLAAFPLMHQPGEKFNYGLNVDVLGYLVEKLSGMSLDKFFKNRLFTPLGMDDTYFYLPEQKYNRLVTAYTEDKQHYPIEWKTSINGISSNYPKLHGTYFAGGAGLSSTVKDYAVFLQMLLNGGTYNGHRFLKQQTVHLMTTNQIGGINLGKNKFGLGFEITTAAGEKETGISESSFAWGGFFSTTYWADPKQHLIGEIYFQQSPFSHGDIASKFKKLVYEALDN